MQWCWLNFRCRGDLLMMVIVGQGTNALAVGAIVSSFLFPAPSGRRPILTEILSQRTVTPKTSKLTNASEHANFSCKSIVIFVVQGSEQERSKKYPL